MNFVEGDEVVVVSTPTNTSSASQAKKIQRVTFSKEETDTLIESIFACPDKCFIFDGSYENKSKKDRAWEWIHNKFNESLKGPVDHQWSIEQLKNRLKNVKRDYCKERTAWFASFKATGGGEAPDEDEMPNFWDVRLEELFFKKLNPIRNVHDSDNGHHPFEDAAGGPSAIQEQRDPRKRRATGETEKEVKKKFYLQACDFIRVSTQVQEKKLELLNLQLKQAQSNPPLERSSSNDHSYVH